MNRAHFEVKIRREEGVPAGVVRVREYGGVTVTAEWPEDAAAQELLVPVEVRGHADRRDAPAYVELFLHDVFLLLNLSVPGSFGGTIATVGGEFRVREVALSARVFAYASTPERLPLQQVTAWYDALNLGTQQVAASAEAIALFELLKLAGGQEDEELSILRLARAAEALVGRPESLERLFALREDIAFGRTPVFHPMHDDALDPWVEDATHKWIEVADAGAGVVIGALQERIRNASTS